MSGSDLPASDLSALASEALDLWQEHLTVAASDPASKAEMMKLLEPSRRLFADWATMMQNGAYGHGHPAPPESGFAAAVDSRRAAAGEPAASPFGAETARSSSDDSALRIAQLAHRVAELEKRLEKLETRARGKSAKTGAVPGES